MNRRTLLTTLLSGLSAGVAAIAGRKKQSEPAKWLHDDDEFNAYLHDNHGLFQESVFSDGKLKPFPQRSLSACEGDFLGHPVYIFRRAKGEGVAEAIARYECEKLSHQRKYGKWTPNGTVKPHRDDINA